VYGVLSVVALSFRFCAFDGSRGVWASRKGLLMAPQSRNLTVLPPPIALPSLRQAPEVVPASLDFLDLVEVFCSLRVLEAWAELRTLLCEDARV